MEAVKKSNNVGKKAILILKGEAKPERSEIMDVGTDKTKDANWACRHCTFLNPKAHKFCGMCGTKLEVSATGL